MQNKNIDFSVEQLSKKAYTLIQEVSSKVIEREELVKTMVLAMFSKSHIFLVGPPGVGKTYVINIMLSAVKDAQYFEYLIMNHTKPEEIFGTVHATSDGEVVYNIENSVLDSHFVMLDEMFKARSEILNSLLGVTSNERTFFMRGRGAVKVPLIMMFGASNEFPSDDALEPFDDRLLIRYDVQRVKDPDNYKRLIKGDFDKDKTIRTELSLEEIEYVFLKAKEVQIPDTIVDVYTILKQKIIQDRIKISDRKMVTAMNNILKTAAFLNGRNYVDYSDLFLMLHIAWRNYTEKEKIKTIIFDVLFGNKNEHISSLQTIKLDLQKIRAYYTQNVKEFIYKRVYVNSKNFEEVFNNSIGFVQEAYNGIGAVSNAIEDVENTHEFVNSVQEQVKRNIFLINYEQKSFDNEVLTTLRTLKKEIVEYEYPVKKFLQNCQNAFDYLNFDPINSLD
jgi:MoxR-like ATPase